MHIAINGAGYVLLVSDFGHQVVSCGGTVFVLV